MLDESDELDEPNELPLTRITGYIRAAFADPDDLVEKAKKALKDVDYDTMVGTGLSGSLVIPILARACGKYWAIVRKQDNAHTSHTFEGQIGRKWIFVDDLIDSGRTRRRVKEVIQDATENRVTWDYRGETVKNPYHTQYVGSYLYGAYNREMEQMGRFGTK
jgi:hypothetical protein